MLNSVDVLYQMNDLTAGTKHWFTISTLSSLLAVQLYVCKSFSLCLYVFLILCLFLCLCVLLYLVLYKLWLLPLLLSCLSCECLLPVALTSISLLCTVISSTLTGLHLSYVTTFSSLFFRSPVLSTGREGRPHMKSKH